MLILAIILMLTADSGENSPSMFLLVEQLDMPPLLHLDICTAKCPLRFNSMLHRCTAKCPMCVHHCSEHHCVRIAIVEQGLSDSI